MSDKDKSGELVKAKRYCEKLLSICPRTEFDIRTRLSRKGFDEKVAEEALVFLRQKGFVDDLEYARVWAGAHAGTKGPELVRFELKKKGIPDGIIEGLLKDLNIAANEEKIVTDIVKKKLVELTKKGAGSLKSGIFRYVVSKGFDAALVEEVINRICDEEHSE